MQQNNHYCQFHILFTTQNEIQCSFIPYTSSQNPSQNNSQIIQLENNSKNKYPITIQFDNNDIYFCKEENTQTISFMKDLVQNPKEWKQYSISYKTKEYLFVAETLLALLVQQFKQKIEKEWIIKETYFQIETENCFLIERITNALECCGLKNVIFQPLTYDYSNQID